MLPFLTNAITISSMARLTFAYPFHQKYVREVWDYSKADVQNIKKSMKDFKKSIKNSWIPFYIFKS